MSTNDTNSTEVQHRQTDLHGEVNFCRPEWVAGLPAGDLEVRP